MDLRFTYVNKTGLELFEIDENDLNPDLSLEMFIMEKNVPVSMTTAGGFSWAKRGLSTNSG